MTRRAGPVPRRHPPDGLRDRRPERPRAAGRHDRRRRRRPGRPGGDDDRRDRRRGPDHRRRHGRVAAQARARTSARRTRWSAATTPSARSSSSPAGGVDVAMEAVGIPATFDLCTRIVRAGGTVANIGVHGAPTTLHLEDLWIKNITITTGLVSGYDRPDAAQARPRRAHRGREARHPPLRARRDRAGLRRVRRGRRARRAEGGAARVAPGDAHLDRGLRGPGGDRLGAAGAARRLVELGAARARRLGARLAGGARRARVGAARLLGVIPVPAKITAKSERSWTWRVGPADDGPPRRSARGHGCVVAHRPQRARPARTRRWPADLRAGRSRSCSNNLARRYA